MARVTFDCPCGHVNEGDFEALDFQVVEQVDCLCCSSWNYCRVEASCEKCGMCVNLRN